MSSESPGCLAAVSVSGNAQISIDSLAVCRLYQNSALVAVIGQDIHLHSMVPALLF
jgi:hypothetical protein